MYELPANQHLDLRSRGPIGRGAAGHVGRKDTGLDGRLDTVRHTGHTSYIH